MEIKKARKKRSPIWLISKDELQNLLDTCESYSDVMRYFGLNPRNGSVKTLYNRIEVDMLDTSNIDKKKWSIGKRNRIENKDIFTEKSTTSRSTVKSRIIKGNLIPYKCEECGNTGEWMGKPISLQLEHKNGVNDDNRLDNLCFLCPNCHSQTSTYSGKRNKIKRKCKCCKDIHKSSNMCIQCLGESQKKVYINEDELYRLVCEDKIAFTKLSNLYGISDNALRKRCLSVGIDPKKRKRI
jgi:Zn finger protein HypA/HybF involved in hydrogenase expression